MLKEIEPFIGDADTGVREKFSRDSMILELMKPTPCLSTVEQFLGNTEEHDPKLFITFMLAFEAGLYALPIKLLNKQLAPALHNPTDLTASEILGCLRTILTRDILTMNKQTCCDLIRIYITCSMMLNNRVETLNIPESFLERLPPEIRFELAIIKTTKYPWECSYEEIIGYYDIVEELASMETGYPRKIV